MKRFLLNLFIINILWCVSVAVRAQPSGSVTQGIGVTTISDMMPGCPSNHVTPLGNITSTDGLSWMVPAENNFLTASKISDLYNTCTGVTPATLAAANLNDVPVTVIDSAGEVITGYLFSDNYFEFYVNGMLVGVDPIPFTPFNSCVVKFKALKPYTLAFKLVDWEENIGLGSEINNNTNYHPGDGGFIAQFSDGTVTDSTWKVQSYYIAPIQDLNTVVELPNGTHSTANATTTPTCNANCFGVHYPIPTNWATAGFNEAGWQKATLYTAAQVTNQPAYTNFANTAWNNARFIWSSNLILDNVVLTRKTVGTSDITTLPATRDFTITNPFGNSMTIHAPADIEHVNLTLFNIEGKVMAEWPDVHVHASESLELSLPRHMPDGLYFLKSQHDQRTMVNKLVHVSAISE